MRSTTQAPSIWAIVALLLATSVVAGLAATEERVMPVAKKVAPETKVVPGAGVVVGAGVQPAPEVEVIEELLPPAMIVELAPEQVEVEHLEQMIRAFRLARLAEELHLEEEQAVRLAVRMREIEEKRKQIEAIRDSVLPKIREELDVSERVRRKIDEARLQYLIERMQDRTAQHEEELRQLEKRMQEALSIEQKARMLLFQKQFQHEMQEMLQMAQEARVRLPEPPRAPRAILPPVVVPEPAAEEPGEPESADPEGGETGSH